MVDRTNLGEVMQLYDAVRLIETALGNFAAGGSIIAMTISGGPAGQAPPGPSLPFRMQVTISTTDVAYPPTMVEAIKTALQARQAALNQQLAELGVTGEVPEMRAASAASAAAPRLAR